MTVLDLKGNTVVADRFVGEVDGGGFDPSTVDISEIPAAIPGTSGSNLEAVLTDIASRLSDIDGRVTALEGA